MLQRTEPGANETFASAPLSTASAVIAAPSVPTTGPETVPSPVVVPSVDSATASPIEHSDATQATADDSAAAVTPTTETASSASASVHDTTETHYQPSQAHTHSHDELWRRRQTVSRYIEYIERVERGSGLTSATLLLPRLLQLREHGEDPVLLDTDFDPRAVNVMTIHRAQGMEVRLATFLCDTTNLLCLWVCAP